MDRDLIKRLTLEAPEHHVNVTVVPDLYDGIGWYTPVVRIGQIPAMILHREESHSLQLMMKRMMDFIGAAFGLIALSPFMVAVAIAIKLDSPGPVFYRSRRVGKKGMVFDCIKFRTMDVGADKAMEKLAHLNERRDGPLFKIANDPRVTRVGRFLRRFSLDELPQLFNVLKGEMSLVGPRPPVVQEYRQYQLEHLRKLEVMPGITGLWQICARQDPSFESYIKFDLEYIENWSLWMDLSILVRTIPVVLCGTGT
jgi:exopolysaccharide biosynthesis polyprenyl glycosylphosphotransferase